jgi:hypothetical protein
MLTKFEIDELSNTLYSRHFRTESSPCLKSPLSVDTKRNLDQMVLSVVECLELNNFKIIRKEKEDGNESSNK